MLRIPTSTFFFPLQTPLGVLSVGRYGFPDAAMAPEERKRYRYVS